jgi:hypothetical protein
LRQGRLFLRGISRGESIPLVLVAVVIAEFGIDILFGKYLHFVFGGAARKLARKLEFRDLGKPVLEHEILDVHGLVFLDFARTVGDIPVELAILGDGVPDEFHAATRLLANLVLEAFFLFITG